MASVRSMPSASYTGELIHMVSIKSVLGMGAVCPSSDTGEADSTTQKRNPVCAVIGFVQPFSAQGG